MTEPAAARREVDISEQPARLLAWPSETGQDGLQAIERDIAELMHRLAESKLTLAEQERQQADRLRKLLLSVIEIADALDRVFRSIAAKPEQVTPQMKIWAGNFRAVRRLIDKLLSEQGVARIENLDSGFDPHWHKVANVVVDSTKPEGTIVEEVLRGYVWQNQVLRKANVAVIRHAETEVEEEPEDSPREEEE